MGWKEWVIYIIILVLLVIVMSIKEKENVFRNLVDFFVEWFGVLKTIVPPLAIIIVILWAWFG